MIRHLYFGINFSIFLILLIFGVLFYLPLKLLLNTNYGTPVITISDSETLRDEFIDKNEEKDVPPIDLRSMKICANFEYELTIRSLFFSNYDRNCTNHVKELTTRRLTPASGRRKSKIGSINENDGIIATEFLDDNIHGMVKNDKKKSIFIAGHILAAMLVGSAVAALVEVLRARFLPVKSRANRSDGNSTSRRSSVGTDIPQMRQRQVRKDTIQAQRSFEIQGMMHRSTLRLLAGRPPPLLRRSSFPAHCQCLAKTDNSVSTTTGAGRLLRRPSFVADSEEDLNGLTDIRRRSRLIRRH